MFKKKSKTKKKKGLDFDSQSKTAFFKCKLEIVWKSETEYINYPITSVFRKTVLVRGLKLVTL